MLFPRYCSFILNADRSTRYQPCGIDLVCPMKDFLIFQQLNIQESVAFPELLFVHFPFINNKSLIHKYTESKDYLNANSDQYYLIKADKKIYKILSIKTAFSLEQMQLVLPTTLHLNTHYNQQTDHAQHTQEYARRYKSEIRQIIRIKHCILQQVGQRVTCPDITWQLLPHILPKNQIGKVEETNHASSECGSSYYVV